MSSDLKTGGPCGARRDPEDTTRRRSRLTPLRKLLKDAAKVAAGALFILLLVEVVIRAVYAVRNSGVEFVAIPYMVGSYGPVPPWVDSLRILEPDDALIWKSRANLHRKYIDVFSPVNTEAERASLLRKFNPVIPESLKNNPVWEISLNSEGFRDDEFTRVKPPGGLRIVCLGDSWTFGANVGQEQAYPQRLRSLLRQDFPGKSVEVFNLGVLGYSSFQGLELLRRKALGYKPDAVLLGFAMNDSGVAGYRDRDIPSSRPFKLVPLLEHLESLKLARYWIQVSKYDEKTMTELMRAMADPAQKNLPNVWGSAQPLEAIDYDKLEPWTRVSPKDYEKNLREMVALARARGAAPVLVYNELRQEGPYRQAMMKISAEESAPLVDGSALIAGARRRMESELEERLGLRPPEPRNDDGRDDEVEVVFRVFMGERPVPQSVNIVGAHPKLGDALPNRVAMHDDGTHGDQKPGDHVWTFAARFAPGTKLFYVYTNSGARDRWEGLDVPQVRSFTVPEAAAATVYLPVESFGKIYMQADGWHTNAAGYELIAGAVRDVLARHERLGKLH